MRIKEVSRNKGQLSPFASLSCLLNPVWLMNAQNTRLIIHERRVCTITSRTQIVMIYAPVHSAIRTLCKLCNLDEKAKEERSLMQDKLGSCPTKGFAVG